jgi:hypothetical protein
MVTMDTNDDCMNEDYLSAEESLMYIDEDPDVLTLCRQNSYTEAKCRKKCVVRLDGARYTIGSDFVIV